MRSLKKLTLFALISLLIFTSNLSVSAEPPQIVSIQSESSNDACYSLDVIFLIDQSSSMGASLFRPSDPTDQRETAVEAMIDWLAENALDRCPNSRHQVGVVSFGTTGRIDLPLTELSPDTFDELQVIQNRLKDEIVADNLYTTQPLEGFILAKAMFDQSTLGKDAARKRVIIWLTDGMIDDDKGNDGKGYVVPAKELRDWLITNFPFNAKVFNREQCIREHVEVAGSFDDVPYENINSCLQKFDATNTDYIESTYIYPVLMNFGENWPKAVRDVFVEIAEFHASTLMDFYEKGGKNRNEIPEYFQKVLAEKVGVPTGRVDCGPIAVNPFLDRATFVFYKFSEDTDVKLRYTDSQGKSFEVSKGIANPPEGFDILEYRSYGTNERYTFVRPYPGIWFIESDRCSTGGISAFYQEVQINPGGYTLPISDIPQYDLEPYYDVSDPYYLTYEMRDSAGNVVEENRNPFFTAQVLASVTSPTQEITDYPLVWNASINRYESTTPLLVPISGKYYVDFIGTTPHFDGNQLDITEVLSSTFTETRQLFRHEKLEFDVYEVTPFVIRIDEPVNDQVINQIHQTIVKGWPLKVEPIEVAVHMESRTGKLDVPIVEILTNPNQAFESWIEYPDGSTSEKITLTLDPKNPEQFVGQFEDIESESPLILHVALSGDFNTEYRPDLRHQIVSFSRHDGSFLYQPGFYKGVVLSLALASLLFALLQLLQHYDPVYGVLKIMEYNKEVQAIGLKGKFRQEKIRKKDITGYDLKALKVGFRPFVQNLDDPEQIDKRNIVVSGKTECNRRIEPFELAPGGSSSYCSEHVDYELMYECDEEPMKPKLKAGAYLLLFFVAVLLLVLFFSM